MQVVLVVPKICILLYHWLVIIPVGEISSSTTLPLVSYHTGRWDQF